MAALEAQYPQAGAEALFGVRPLAQDRIDEKPRCRTDLAGLVAQRLRCDFGMAAMAGRHVLLGGDEE
jgi:hypothetical protein